MHRLCCSDDINNQITRARGSEEAAKIDAQKEAEARVRRAEIESEAARYDAIGWDDKPFTGSPFFRDRAMGCHGSHHWVLARFVC